MAASLQSAPIGSVGPLAAEPGSGTLPSPRRVATLVLGMILISAAGFAHGARVALGAPAPSARPSPPEATLFSPRPGLQRERQLGAFWAPAASTARPPELRLRPSLWTPGAPPATCTTCPSP